MVEMLKSMFLLSVWEVAAIAPHRGEVVVFFLTEPGRFERGEATHTAQLSLYI